MSANLATDDPPLVPAAAAGFATWVLGYLVLAVVGGARFEVSAAGTTGQPDLLAGFFLAGLVYPLVFGAAGGVLAAVTADEDEPSGRRSPS